MKLKNKKLFLIAILCSFYSAQAGSSWTKRSGCTWLAKRYKASAHILSNSSYSLDYDRGCSWATANKKGGCSSSIDFAEAWAHAGSDYCANKANDRCGWSTGLKSDLFKRLEELKILKPSQLINEEHNNIDVVLKPLFDEGRNDLSYRLDSIKIHLESNRTGNKNLTYRLTLWKPNDNLGEGIEDSLYTDENTIRFFEIQILNGKINYSGNLLNPNDFILTNHSDYIELEYVGNNQIINLSDGINCDSVALTSDANIVPSSASLLGIQDNEFNILIGKSEVQIYPIPASKFLNVVISSKNEDFYDIEIYNLAGKFCQSITALNCNIEQKINIEQLKSGTYFMFFRSKNFTSVRKFVKE